ncbi:NAD-dependent epimerase/dehydratase family protein [Polynucleobacter alcilacus]|uniref:NAD-dependent epimerase/dehydratase family protein n=1 Tax=Polynucleobacter alcilacus TaxID=1819739 RepID=UPI001C0B81FE|nr:NAD-dependent epimerase/dehydratase family protein [Polynucleobacter alcilacus]MBU3568205.1 NAD-dependent epimerase/dehydratase family protein [Polynucleobacter alcilacus]
MFLSPAEDLKDIETHLGSLVEQLQNKTIFLSGATGFIGKCLVEGLVWLNRSKGLNLSIHSVSRNPEKFFCEYPHFREYSEFYLLFGDIRDRDISFSGIAIDFVIHAATDVVGKVESSDLFGTCINGTSNVLNLAIKNKCKNFLLLSSGAVYGRQPIDLEGIPESYEGAINLSSSGSAYALGKQGSEWLTQQARNEMEVKIARCFAFVGPYLPLDQHFAVGNFIRNAISGEDIKILGDGLASRTYLYTSDLFIWLLNILLDGENGGVWNIGGDEVISIADLALMVAELINPNVGVQVCQLPSGNPHRYIPDIRKVSIDMGLAPRINLRQAIQKTADWNKRYGKY